MDDDLDRRWSSRNRASLHGRTSEVSVRLLGGDGDRAAATISIPCTPQPSSSRSRSRSLCRPESAYASTIFNISNVIMGVSLLSLPYAFRSAGFLVTISLLLLFGTASSTGAKILASCQRTHLERTGTALITYGDIGEAAFGLRGRWFIQIVFFCELFCAAVGLFLLALNSVNNLLPLSLEISPTVVRVFVWSGLTVTTWPRSLNLLSYVSLVGIFALLNMVGTLIFGGLWRTEAPGSLRDPAETYILPQSWMQAPSAIGLCMACFAGILLLLCRYPIANLLYIGTACFPGFYTAMKQSSRFPSAIHSAYSFALFLYMTFGVVGYLMFGEDCDPVIINNLTPDRFPRAMTTITMVLIFLIPASKFALTLYPVMLETEILLFSRFQHPSDSDSCRSLCCLKSNLFRRILLRTGICALVLLVATLLPEFETIVQLLGSLFSITSSVLFPMVLYLAFLRPQDDVKTEAAGIFVDDSPGHDVSEPLLAAPTPRIMMIPEWKRVAVVVLVVFFTGIGVLGTAWTLLPKRLL